MTPGENFPYIYSRTEELVWKWEQSKLCGQRINVILESIMMSQGPPNKPDSDGKFISVEDGRVNVQQPAKLTNLGLDDYQVGILWTADSAHPKIILLSSVGEKRTSTLKAIQLRVRDFLLAKSSAMRYNWSTEYWVLDSVVIDSRPIDEREMIIKAVPAIDREDTTYICIGLPATAAGPLFNTLVSTWRANAGCFDYLNGFIWINAAVNQRTFTIYSDKSSASSNDPVFSLEEMNGRSWLVEAKLIFKLERPGRVRAAILAELLGVSQVRVTSTHKPITHS